MSEDEFELDPTSESSISLEASAWIAKRDEGFTAEDQDGFFDWLAQDPRHKEIYNERLAFWDGMDGMADWRPEHSSKPNMDLLAYRTPSRWKKRFCVLGAIAASLLVGLLFFERGMQQEQFESRVLAFGGAQSYENYVLDDGSVVELNKDAEVSVQYTSDKRLIFLHTGEAHFMVAKDKNRPFQVRAGDATVEATGTAFNVALEESGIEVLVTEGRVRIDAPSMVSSQGDVGFIENPAQELVEGQRSVIAPSAQLGAPEITTISVEEIDQRLSWKGEILDFTQVPLSEVMTEFNRRNRTKIVVGDPDLLDLEITAKLRSNNLDGFLALLDVTMNLEAERDGKFKISLRNKPL